MTKLSAPDLIVQFLCEKGHKASCLMNGHESGRSVVAINVKGHTSYIVMHKGKAFVGIYHDPLPLHSPTFLEDLEMVVKNWIDHIGEFGIHRL